MGRRETLIHLGAQAGTKAIHALGEPDHTLRDAAYVMTKVLRHDVEMAPGLGGGCVDLLAKTAHLLAKAADLLAKAAHLLVKAAHLLANALHVLA